MNNDDYKEKVLMQLRDIEIDIGIICIVSMIADIFLLFIMIAVLFK